MTPGMATAMTAIAAALGLAAAAGMLHNRRQGVIRGTDHPGDLDTSRLGLSGAGPTIVHFTAAWCGPCAAVRRVIDEVCDDLPAVAHTEIDIDADPATARALSVLSLPTTFIFDTGGTQRYRAAGVPKASELRAALDPLLA